MATELPKWRISKCPSGLSPQRRRAGRKILPSIDRLGRTMLYTCQLHFLVIRVANCYTWSVLTLLSTTGLNDSCNNPNAENTILPVSSPGLKQLSYRDKQTPLPLSIAFAKHNECFWSFVNSICYFYHYC